MWNIFKRFSRKTPPKPEPKWTWELMTCEEYLSRYGDMGTSLQPFPPSLYKLVFK